MNRENADPRKVDFRLKGKTSGHLLRIFEVDKTFFSKVLLPDELELVAKPSKKGAQKPSSRGNGNGQSAGGGSGNKKGPKYLVPPMLGENSNDQLRPAGKKKKPSTLTPGEREYLKKIAPKLDAPPDEMTIVDFMQAAASFTKCISVNGNDGSCSITSFGRLDSLKESLKKRKNELVGALLSYKDSALRSIKRRCGYAETHLRFVRSIIAKLDGFTHDAEGLVKQEQEARTKLEQEKEGKLKSAENLIIPKAIKSALDKVAAVVLTAGIGGEAASALAGISHSFWVHYSLFAASALSIVYIAGGYALDAIKGSKQARIERTFERAVDKLCRLCTANRRKLLQGLAGELLQEIDKIYPRDMERQRTAIADFVREKGGMELDFGSTNGKRMFAPDDIMLEAFAKALNHQPF